MRQVPRLARPWNAFVIFVMICHRTPALAAKLEAERRLKEGISGHRTGLPKKLLDMFAALEPPVQLTPLKKPKLKLPYLGIAQYVGEFAEPTDAEYEPPVAKGAPSSPRLFANPELSTQARVEIDSIYER
jgi:U1 small nuclear ribonucleoprotein